METGCARCRWRKYRFNAKNKRTRIFRRGRYNGGYTRLGMKLSPCRAPGLPLQRAGRALDVCYRFSCDLVPASRGYGIASQSPPIPLKINAWFFRLNGCLRSMRGVWRSRLPSAHRTTRRPTCRPTHRPTNPPTHPHTHTLTHPPIYPTTHSPTLPTYPPTPVFSLRFPAWALVVSTFLTAGRS